MNVITIVLAIIVVFLLFRLWFRRDPKRTAPGGRVIVTPADGKIIDVTEVNGSITRKKGVGNIKTFCSDVAERCYLISIFMSLVDVHVNRISLSGKVLSVKHSRGRFLPAQHLKNGLLNEKTETLIKNKDIGNIKVVQIAGIFVRRIKNWLEKGQEVKTGQRLGMIHFGSQLWVIIPKRKSIKVTVKKGDKVYAGETIVARY